MQVNGQLGLSSDLGSGLHDLDPPAREAAHLGMCFDALDDVPVGFGNPNGGIDVDAVRTIQRGVQMSLQATDQISRQKREHPALGRLDHIVSEAGQGHATRSTLIDQSRHAGVNAA